MTNRRKFLRNASAMAVAGTFAANNSVLAAQNALTNINAKKSFGLQIYSLTVDWNDREFVSDIPGGLKRVAQMGYTSIELAGYNPEGKVQNATMAEFKKYADDAGLKITATHVNPPIPGYTKDNLNRANEFWKRASDHHAAIGCKYIIQPGQPATRSSEEVKFTGEAFNEAGKIAKAAGLTFGFHNHSGEFERVVPGGREAIPRNWRWGPLPEGTVMIYDGLIEATDPELVVFEMDVYWVVNALQDPVAYLKKYPKRFRLLHIKDISVLGESGWMNFQKIFETAYANGVTDFIVELENYREGSQFEGVKKCADYLLNASFVK